MSLTDDWKGRKLDPMWYYVKYKDSRVGKALLIETPDYYGFYNNCDLNDEVGEVLAPIPSYEEFLSMKEDNVDKIIRNVNVRLLSREVERLRALLKECNNELKLLRTLSLPMASKGALSECDDLLTRINTAIGESEE